MRYTKIALLTFGAGLLLGLIVVMAEIDWLGRLASSLMALGLAAIPVGMIADWRLATRTSPPPKKRARIPPRRNAAATRRPKPRKPAPPKR
ncbi:MAG: hypothetical protein ACREE9_18385 [Stellaceae bacterium]